MDLGGSNTGSILPSITSYNFEPFEDEVSKESGDLSVDATYVYYFMSHLK